jgi:hypothetical protein
VQFLSRSGAHKKVMSASAFAEVAQRIESTTVEAGFGLGAKSRGFGLGGFGLGAKSQLSLRQ